MRRRFLTRLTLAAAGMTLLCLAGFVALGWGFRSEQSWLRKVLGEAWSDRLNNGYERMAAAWLPEDRDGDGASDGREWFRKTNPRDYYDVPLIMVQEDRGAVMMLAGFWNFGGTREIVPGMRGTACGTLVEPGRPVRLRGRLVNWYEPVPAPPGLAVALKAQAPGVQLSRVGEAPTAGAEGSLLVPVPGDGWFEFEVQCAPRSPAPAGWQFGTLEIVATHPKSGGYMGTFRVLPAWALSPVMATAGPFEPEPAIKVLAATGTGAAGGTGAPGLSMGSAKPSDLIQLRWPAVPASAQSLVVEAARDEEGAPWFGVFEMNGIYVTRTSCLLVRGGSLPARKPDTGRLKFRVVGVRYSRSE